MTDSIGRSMRPWVRRRALPVVMSAVAIAMIAATLSPPAYAATRVFYVDSQGGSDSNSGTSTGNAWRTLGRVESASLRAGDNVRFRRDRVWSGKLDIKWSGTADAPIVFDAYGSGALPVFNGASACIDIPGSYITLRYVKTDNCTWAGVAVRGDYVRVEHIYTTRNSAGIAVMESSYRARILRNSVVNNRRMHVLTDGGWDDSGAFGVLLRGVRTEVAFNSISGHDAFSYDYGRDGAAVEIYGARYNHIHHNRATNNRTFTELGNPRAAYNTFAYNVIRSSLTNSQFLVTRGAESGWGPVYGTKLYNNSVYLTGSGTEGFVCHDGCSREILIMRNNIIRAVKKVGYADGPVDANYNVYYGGIRQFNVGSVDRVADPRFVSSSDLRLRSTSPAINSGMSLSYTYDVLRLSLVGKPDRGAYEYQG